MRITPWSFLRGTHGGKKKVMRASQYLWKEFDVLYLYFVADYFSRVPIKRFYFDGFAQIHNSDLKMDPLGIFFFRFLLTMHVA